ncbi:hypothetical protein B0H13DRAFT_2552169 [Mycena leptocephala]|nr:hypothetical protein B0H13DRAFT_2552169 [Mycena leptocephala]
MIMSIDSPNCQITGDADLYGLGVRISVYSQMILEIIRDSMQWEAGLTLEIPSLFTVAAMECVLILKAFQRQLTPFDATITIFMTGSLSTIRPVTISESRLAAFGASDWSLRMNAGLDLACEIWLYTFSRQRADTGPAIFVWIAAYVLALAAMALAFVVSLIQERRRAKQPAVSKLQPSQSMDSDVVESGGAPEIPLEIIDQTPFRCRLLFPFLGAQNHPPTDLVESMHATNPWPTSPPSRKRRPNNKFRRSIVPWAKLAHKLFWGVAFNIAGVELMLVWNDVAGVHAIAGSSGQVMALLVALFTTVQFCLAASGVSTR